jgi:hypothetical protein
MAFFRVHSDVRLQSEVPLLPLARLVHLRIALSAPVLGRRRRMNNGRIDDCTRGDAPPPGSPDIGSPRSASPRPDHVSPADGGTVRSCSRPVPVPSPGPRPRTAAAPAIHTAPLPRPDRSG